MSADEIKISKDGRVTKMIETFEIQRRKRSFNKVRWIHYQWYATWEIAGENIRLLREHKGGWIYQLLRCRTTTELTRLS